MLDFWAWSSSDLLTNTSRGLIAEYIVAHALGIKTAGVRDGWAPFDLQTPTGIKVEVKSCSYLQSWFQKVHSYISFSTKKSTAWSPDTNEFVGEQKRQADVYVFALLAHKDKTTLNPLDVEQWEFYVVPTITLDQRKGDPKSISLSALLRFRSGPHLFSELRDVVEKAACFD